MKCQETMSIICTFHSVARIIKQPERYNHRTRDSRNDQPRIDRTNSFKVSTLLIHIGSIQEQNTTEMLNQRIHNAHQLCRMHSIHRRFQPNTDVLIILTLVIPTLRIILFTYIYQELTSISQLR